MENYQVNSIQVEPWQVKIGVTRLEDTYDKVFYIQGLDDLRKYCSEIRNHFFDPSTMHFFRSTVSNFDLESGLFITSEKHPDSSGEWYRIRKYTVRKFNYESGKVEHVSTMGEYLSLSGAKTRLKKEKGMLCTR